MKRILAALLLALAFCGVSHAQVAQTQPFQACGNTITFTANTSGNIPAPVQATCGTTISFTQYLITNTGTNLVFVSFGTSATATANCVVPTSTSTATIPVLAGAAIVITTGAGSYFCGITTGSTSVVYVTPGVGS